MERIISYVLASGDTTISLERIVNDLLPKWQPYGSPVKMGDRFIQAMVKYEKLGVVEYEE